MGTEILRPQDCLMRVGPSTTSMGIPRRKPSTNSYYYTNPKFSRKIDQRKQPQQHRYFPQSEKDTTATITTSVVKNGFRSSPSTPATTKSVVKRDLTTSAALVKNETTTVTILKRGEFLDNINSKKKAENLIIKRSVSGDLSSGFSSSGSESSDSERVVRSEVYAGNAFYLSPAPSSLPLPTFSIKKEGGGLAIIDDSATKDLRRLLRLD